MGSNDAGDASRVTVHVAALTSDPVTGLPIVLLQDDLGRTVIPLSVGLSEASALAAEIDNVELARPATHQLTAAMLERCGARVLGATISGVDGGLFCACIELELAGGTVVTQDARPSDALALALHTGAEIRVSIDVLEHVGTLGLRPEWDALLPAPSACDEDVLSLLTEDVFGKWKM
ncbi:MAG TPA: bifunctional nuclease family protein [Kofleriaceae bacterium]|nr:bifunctional nuclease family protein [Kofleriaceae bacterium]